jgi:DNA-binding LacI/PurR family transcriptional regulator
MRHSRTATSHSSQKRRLIALALPHLSEKEMELVQGVRQNFLPLGNAYELLVLSGGYEAHLRKLADMDKLAGAIGEFMSPLWLESLLSKGIPVVQLGMAMEKRVPSVDTDREAMGREAASILLNQGVQSLAYLGASGPFDSAQLWKAFQASSLDKGYTARVSNEFSAPMIKEFLSSLNLPSGLLCSTDRLARLAVQSAMELALKIPHDLAVIGVGNARMESLYMGMDISSFELPLREIGLRASSLMIDLLEGGHQRNCSHRISATLHERESSLRLATGVSRAIAYLRSNPETKMNAGELARFAGMSRRSFEMRVQKEYGLSPGALLKEMRQARAEKLLRETDEAIGDIGKKCGYEEAALFSTAFNRWTGMSPRDYRKGQKTQPL